MPLPTPPAPPVQPQPTQVEIIQKQNQDQNQTTNNNNGYNPQSNTSNTNNTVSEAQNEVRQEGSLSNLQVNNNNSSYFGFANNTRIPSNNLTLTASIDANGKPVGTLAYVHNFGGKSKKLAYESIAIHNSGATASVCANLLKEDIVVDYELAPEFATCKAFSKYKAVAPMETTPTASSELAETKAMLQELIKANKELMMTNQALQLRLTQMQHSPKPVKALY